MTNPQNISLLIHDIREAFKDSQYPGDDYLATITEGGDNDEPLGVKAAFKGKHWHEATLSTLNIEKSALSFFTPAAFRFYLPAYLIVVLEQWEQAGILVEFVLYSLMPKDDDEILKPWFYERIDGFTNLQVQVIRKFLDVYATLSDDPEDLWDDPGDSPLAKALAFWATYRMA